MTRPTHPAHRLADELPPPRPTIVPTRITARDVAALILQVAAGVALLYGLLVALLLIGGAS